MNAWAMTIETLARVDVETKSARPERKQAPREHSIKVPVGRRFGMLVVLGEGDRYLPNARGYEARRWRCRCDCGRERDISMANIRRGRANSCGCKAGAGTRFRSYP